MTADPSQITCSFSFSRVSRYFPTDAAIALTDATNKGGLISTLKIRKSMCDTVIFAYTFVWRSVDEQLNAAPNTANLANWQRRIGERRDLLIV